MSQNRGGIRKEFDLGNKIIVRIKQGNDKYEMIVDSEEAYKSMKKLQDLRKDKEKEVLDLDDIKHSDIYLPGIFETYYVFKDVKKGDKWDEIHLEKVFETTDETNIAIQFLLEGEFSWTQKQRTEWSEKKKLKIINLLSRNCINPQSKKPHPPKRIEKAMDEAKVTIDLNRSAEEQLESVIKAIQVLIPIRMENIKMAVKVPVKYSAKAYNLVAQYTQIKKSEWQNDGSWLGVVTMPAGVQMEFIDTLNSLTHGRVQTKLLQD